MPELGTDLFGRSHKTRANEMLVITGLLLRLQNEQQGEEIQFASV